jgi:peptidoglycan/LPS O-acetylase OafA/YrhL
LPILALLQKTFKSRYVLIPALAVAGLYSWPFIYFSAGALAALCTTISGSKARIGWQAGAIMGITLICLTATCGISSNWLQAICLTPVFVCLALEFPMFSLLGCRPLRFIGEASYSNYVLHGAILYILSLTVVDTNALLSLPLWTRIAGLLMFAVISLIVSVLSYRYIERPCIRLGSALSLRIGTRFMTSSDRSL